MNKGQIMYREPHRLDQQASDRTKVEKKHRAEQRDTVSLKP